MALARLRACVYGQVQGVNFRSHTRRNAYRLGLGGFVHNEEDGSVLVVAEGERERVEELLNWLHRGPSLASVERVRVSWEEYRGDFSGFEVRY